VLFVVEAAAALAIASLAGPVTDVKGLTVEDDFPVVLAATIATIRI
jgi:hypothetical protein